jgi:hypothetical protein
VTGKRIPQAALAAAKIAVLNATGADDGPDEHEEALRIARAALEAAMPAVERHVLRAAARRILALDEAGRDRRDNKGPFWDMRTCLRKLARGEALPAPGAEDGSG